MLTIRPAQKQDSTEIQNCIDDALGQYIKRIGKKSAPMLADTCKQIQDGYVYVAVDKNNLILGYAVFYPVADHIHLESVAVFKKHRQQGIGEALITYCENVADDKGFSSVQLYTNQAMWENFGFYTHLGYKKVGQNTQDDFERIFFRKDIQRAKNET